jgi:endonuclease/exonuclease/phosphatase family metal-dependent hydrolase
MGMLLVAGLASAFAWVGSRGTWQTPEIVEREGLAAVSCRGELTLLAVNLAKLGFHRGGLDFTPQRTLEARVDRAARALIESRADVVCLSEVVQCGGPVRYDQVRALAEAGGYRYSVFLPNYDFGVPGLRICAGNAILSKFPLRRARGQQLAGERPFWSPTNNRRALWCELRLGAAWLPLASIRNDSFDLANNADQVRELLLETGGAPALIAGDLNCTPTSVPGRLWRSAANMEALDDGPPTHPADAPTRRIDDALWPATWELIEHAVVDTGSSDHLGVVFRWRLPD